MATSAELLNDIQQLLPTVYIEQITLDEGGFNQASVSATISLKDIIEKDNISQWFLAEQGLNLQDYMTLNVVLTKSENAFNQIFNLKAQGDGQSFDKLPEFSYEDILKIKNENSGQVLLEQFKLPSKDQLEKQEGVFYSENFIVNLDDGTQEITVPIKTNFRFLFDEEVDKYLSMICFLTFNLQLFAKQFNIEDINDNNALSQNFTNTEIIKDGKVVSTVQYFLLPNGNFYYGQFHAIENEFDNNIVYRTGLVEGPDSQTLTLVTDVNNIINDQRKRKIFGDIAEIDATSIINNFTKNDLQIQKLLDKKKSKKNAFSKYFSEANISQDELGNCRFSFFFDKKKFILDNSFYNVPLKNNDNIISNLVKLKDISIFRIRKDIKEINLISENNAVFVASNSSNPAGVDVLKTPPLLSPNVNSNSSYIIENNVDGINPNEIKCYSVLDDEISQINYGFYKYKVTMQIVDPTKDYIARIYNELCKNEGNVLSRLENYYNLSISNKILLADPQQVNGVQPLQAKFIPYFNSLTNKFISDFKIDFNNEFTAAREAIDKFLLTAEEFGFYNVQNEAQRKELFLSFRNLLFPPASSPETIKLAIEVVKIFTNKLQQLLEISDSETKSKVSSKYKNNIIYIEHTFESSKEDELSSTKQYNIKEQYDNYFNATNINGAGYKIVDATNSFTGLSSLSVNQYKKIADFVSQKHFNDFNNINIKQYYGEKVLETFNFDDDLNEDNSKFSYLPVLSVGTINKKYDLGKLSENFLNQKFYLDLFLDIINYNTTKQINFNKQSVDPNSKLSSNKQILKGQLLDLISFGSSGIHLSEQSSVPVSKTKEDIINIFGSKSQDNITPIDEQVSQNKRTSLSSLSLNDMPAALLLHILMKEMTKADDDLKNAKDFSIFNPLNENMEKNDNFFLDKIAASAALSLLFGATSENVKQEVVNYIRDLPIPIKHLIVSRGNNQQIINAYGDKNEVKDGSKYLENFFKYWINFKKIYEIQYFGGFENNNVKSPIWLKLTKNVLENTINRPILCRIQKYKLPTLEEYFPDINKLEMPVFNKYFYITPTGPYEIAQSMQAFNTNVLKVPAGLPSEVKNFVYDKIGPASPKNVEIVVEQAKRAAAPVAKIPQAKIQEIKKNIRPLFI